MKKQPSIVRLHGELGKLFGKKFLIYGNSVSELMRGLFFNTKNKLRQYLMNEDPESSGYKVIINGKIYRKDFDENKLESLKHSELCFPKEIETLDIVPVIQGAKKFAQILAGVVLLIVGIAALAAGGWASPYLITAGIGLIAGGVITLLTKPPKFEDFREVDGATGRTSYIFNGPQNTTREGGPVPVIYGQLLVGSQVISASYNIKKINADPTLVYN